MQRKKSNKTPLANAQEKAFMGWIKGRKCCCCGNRPVICHHCAGATEKIKVNYVTVLIGHWFLLPLCQTCDDIITHGSRRAFRERFGPQSVLCLKELEEYPESVPDEVKEGIRLWSK